jgi:hypothetical protein
MRALLCFALLVPATAFAGRVFPLPPYHPTVLITDVDGKPTPIVGATSDGRARTKVGDKTRTLPRDAGVRFLRAPEYGPGFIELKNPTDNEPVYVDGSYILLSILRWPSARLTENISFRACLDGGSRPLEFSSGRYHD